MSEDQWRLLYEKYQAEILEQAGIIKGLREENTALREMLQRVVTAYEDSLEAEYSHRGEFNIDLNAARALLEGESR